MPKRKVAAKKTGGARPRRRQTGSALYQSGNGFISTLLPGPLGSMAKMMGLGRRQRGGLDPKEYARALLGTVGPLVQRDVGSWLK